MKQIIKVILFFIFALFAGQTVFAQVNISSSFINGGFTRTYLAYIPAVYHPSVAVPLVLNLHGYTSDAAQQEVYGDFRPIADTADFIIVIPDGTFVNNERFWNTFDATSPDDVAFLSALIDTMSAHYNIDPNRIYCTGMSNGGYMSYDLACKLSSRIAAIASVAGTMTVAHEKSCAPVHPTPVMQIHGTADGTVAYGGSIIGIAIDSLVNYWVRFNHCSLTPAVTPLPDVVTTDGCTAIHYVYSGGDKGTSVEFYKIIGGGHSWPGAPININVTNMDFSASREIWRFFRPYRLNQLYNGVENPEQALQALQVYPNPSSGNFTIKGEVSENCNLEIFNLMGQKVYQQKLSKGTIELPIDASYFGTGLFLVRVSDNHSQLPLHTQVVLRNL